MTRLMALRMLKSSFKLILTEPFGNVGLRKDQEDLQPLRQPVLVVFDRNKPIMLVCDASGLSNKQVKKINEFSKYYFMKNGKMFFTEEHSSLDCATKLPSELVLSVILVLTRQLN